MTPPLLPMLIVSASARRGRKVDCRRRYRCRRRSHSHGRRSAESLPPTPDPIRIHLASKLPTLQMRSRSLSQAEEASGRTPPAPALRTGSARSGTAPTRCFLGLEDPSHRGRHRSLALLPTTAFSKVTVPSSAPVKMKNDRQQESNCTALFENQTTRRAPAPADIYHLCSGS